MGGCLNSPALSGRAHIISLNHNHNLATLIIHLSSSIPLWFSLLTIIAVCIFILFPFCLNNTRLPYRSLVEHLVYLNYSCSVYLCLRRGINYAALPIGCVKVGPADQLFILNLLTSFYCHLVVIHVYNYVNMLCINNNTNVVFQENIWSY